MEEENKYPHKNHRQRLYETINGVGFDKVNDFLALEFILTYVIPRQDTNPIAHRLIDRYGSISRAMEASVDELQNIKGLGLQSARMFTMLPKVFERYWADKGKTSNKPLRSKNDLITYTHKFMQNKAIEELYGVFMDGANKVVGTAKLSSGDAMKVVINRKTLLQRCLDYPSATTITIAHCHPNNAAFPSTTDKIAIKSIIELLNNIGLDVYDSLIFAGKSCYSMIDEKAYEVEA